MRYAHSSIFAMLIISFFISGCSKSQLDKTATPPPMGSEFTEALKREYVIFAKRDSDRYNDAVDAKHFAVKAMQANSGEGVLPEDPSTWDLKKEYLQDLTTYRQRLLWALNNSGRIIAPQLAAEAQVSYDCWLEEVEEGFQKDGTGKCRDIFMTRLTELERLIQTKTPIFVLWFDENSAKKTEKNNEELARIVKTSNDSAHKKIIIRGFTDGQGGRKFNLRLSQARADMVMKELLAAGIPAERIKTVVGMGEAPHTKDVQPDNRRVEVQVG